MTASDNGAPTLYVALGRLAVSAANAEFKLQTLIWDLMETDIERGSKITNRVRYGALVPMALNLWLAKINLEPKGLRDDFARLSRAGNERNDMIHAWWPTPEAEPPIGFHETGGWQRYGQNNKGEIERSWPTQQEIDSLSAEFDELAQHLVIYGAYASDELSGPSTEAPNSSSDGGVTDGRSQA